MASINRDYYAVLGVASDADARSIERAYRDALSEIDAEIAGGEDVDELKEIRRQTVEAYHVLSDPTRRRAYDELRATPQWWSEIDPGQLDRPAARPEDETGRLLTRFLRRFVAESAPGHGVVDVVLPFEMAALGGQARLRFPVRTACPACGGTGGAGGRALGCPGCSGTGSSTAAAESDWRPLAEDQPGREASDAQCPQCGGRGWLVPVECESCGGRGWFASLGRLSLEIPPGVSDGTLIPLPGFGDQAATAGEPRYARVRVSSHPFFRRRGRDVLCRIPVSERAARDGSTIMVRTLRGMRLPVTIPPHTASGTVVRLKGEGIEFDGQRGDQLIEIEVQHRPPGRTGGRKQ